MIAQFRYGLLATATVLVIACGDASHASAPQPPVGSALAKYMDSLVTAQKSNPSDSLWASIVRGAEYVPAYGGSPSPITVNTDSGVQTWQAFIYAQATPGADTSYTLWAFSDTTFTKVLLTGVIGSGAPGGTGSYFIRNDTAVVYAIAFNRVTTASVDSSCTFTLGLANVVPFDAGSCNLATFTAAVHMTFGSDSIAIAAQPVTGVILK